MFLQNASPAQEAGAQQHHPSVLHDSEQARGSLASHVLGAEEESAPWCDRVPAESFSGGCVGDAGRRVGRLLDLRQVREARSKIFQRQPEKKLLTCWFYGFNEDQCMLEFSQILA